MIYNVETRSMENVGNFGQFSIMLAAKPGYCTMIGKGHVAAAVKVGLRGNTTVVMNYKRGDKKIRVHFE